MAIVGFFFGFGISLMKYISSGELCTWFGDRIGYLSKDRGIIAVWNAIAATDEILATFREKPPKKGANGSLL